MTGSRVWAATTPGQRGGQAGAGDDDPQPAHLGVAGVVRDHVGVAVGGHHPHLVVDAALLELLRRGLHGRHVALGAHDDADARRVDLDAGELLLDLRARRPRPPARPARASAWPRSSSPRSCGDVPPQLHAVELDHVGGSIRGRPGGGPSVAQRGHAEHAPAGGDDPPVALRGARRGRPPRRPGTASSPLIGSPLEALAGIAARGQDDADRRALVPDRRARRRGRPARSRRAAARAGRSAGAGAPTWVSGSPKRTLNSSTSRRRRRRA